MIAAIGHRRGDASRTLCERKISKRAIEREKTGVKQTAHDAKDKMAEPA